MFKGLFGKSSAPTSESSTDAKIKTKPADSQSASDNSKEMIDEDELQMLIDTFKTKLFKGVQNFNDDDNYFIGLIRKLTLEVAHKGDKITTRGKLGRKLYIIQSGEVDVLDEDDTTVKVTLGKGTLFGEHSIIFDAPRNATVVVHSETLTIYSLHQQDFKEYQQKEAVKADLNRVNLLMASKDLKDKLSDDQRRMLVGKMSMKHAEFGELIFQKDTIYDEVVVIESGSAMVYYADDLSGKSEAEIDETLGIIRNIRHGNKATVVKSSTTSDASSPMPAEVNKRVSKYSKRSSIASMNISSPSPGATDSDETGTPQKLTSSKWGSINLSKVKAVGEQSASSPGPSAKRGSVFDAFATSASSSKRDSTNTRSRRVSVIKLSKTTTDTYDQDSAIDFRRSSVVNAAIPNAQQGGVEVDKTHQFDEEMGHFACVVGKGCIIGIQALAGNSMQKSMGVAWQAMEDGVTTGLTVQVISHKLVYSVFSVETFERLFGSKALTCEGKIPEATLGGAAFGRSRIYNIDDFNPKDEWELLGGGKPSSASFVMLAQLNDQVKGPGAPAAEKAHARHSLDTSKDTRRSSFMQFLATVAANRGKRPSSSSQPPASPRPSTSARNSSPNAAAATPAPSNTGLTSKMSSRMGGTGANKTAFCLKIFNKAQLMKDKTGDQAFRALEVMRSMKTLKELRDNVTGDQKICIVDMFGTMGTKAQICYAMEPLWHGSLRRILKLMDDKDSEFYIAHRRSSALEKRLLSSHQSSFMPMQGVPAFGSGDSADSADGSDKFEIKMHLIRFYGACIAGAIDYMSSYNVAHRQICPENCMFDRSGYPKLVDFGACKRFPYKDFKDGKLLGKSYTLVGLTDYQAPEFLDKSKGHDTGVDQWALGILLYELFMGNRHTPFRYVGTAKTIFDDRVTDDIIPIIQKRIVDTRKEGVKLPPRTTMGALGDTFNDSSLSEALVDLIERLVVFEPEKRYPFGTKNTGHIVYHSFFDDDMVNAPYAYKRERVVTGDYVPSFTPSVFQRKVDPSFDKASLFMKYFGDQQHFIGFR